jgi:hypothetical protein
MLAPGEHATDVDLDDPHTQQAISDGHLIVISVPPIASPRSDSGEPEPSAPTPIVEPDLPPPPPPSESSAPATGGKS